MTCSACGAETPRIPSPEDPQIETCLRCREQYAWQSPSRIDGAHQSEADLPPMIATDDDWDDLYDPASPPPSTLVSMATPVVGESKAEPTRESTSTKTKMDDSAAPKYWQWFLLVLGLSAFSCGAALVAWSFTDQRHELWNLGAPLALVGQLVFLVGLFLQLDVLWIEGRRQGNQIERLGETIRETNATDPRGTRAPESRSRSVIENSPEVVLQDLKSRLDLVGTRLYRS